jgi:MmyB-like transcription regulator ligand binding domain
VRSERFRQLWSRHEVRPQLGGGIHRIDHPQVGLLELRHDKFTVAGGDGQMLVVYHAAPGSSSEQALALLATLSDGQRPDGPPADTASHPTRPRGFEPRTFGSVVCYLQGILA